MWVIVIGTLNMALVLAVYLSARALPDRALFRSFLLINLLATALYLLLGGWSVWLLTQQLYALGALLALAEGLRIEGRPQWILWPPLCAVFSPLFMGDPLMAYQLVRVATALTALWVATDMKHHTRWGWLAWGYGIGISDICKAFGGARELLTWCDPMVWITTCLVWILTMRTPGMEFMEGWSQWKTSIQSH